MQEKTIETKQCKHCQTSFDITDKDIEFYDKISPTFMGKKYQVPSPSFCPDCSQQRRLNFRNERKLYHRKCDITGQTIISMFSPDKPYKVYATKERFSDKRDAIEYGREFDFNKSFFQQFDELLKSVPQIALLQVGSENCDYNNFWGYNKNCYLCFDIGRDEDCSYLARSYKCKNCFDLSYSAGCEMSYQLSNCDTCVKCNYCIDSEKCYDCNFCYNCANCNNCFMCSNLVNKQNHICNKPYSKEDYEKEVANLKAEWTAKLYADFLDLMKKAIHKYANITSCEKVEWDYLIRCKNCREVYGAKDTEDCAYVIDPMIADHVFHDAFSGNSCSYNLETIGCENLSHSKFCFSCRAWSNNLIYCYFCHGCRNCFGCMGLKNKEYCIFNKQYTKAEYETLVAQIIEHMIKNWERGEFFPVSISPFCYNEALTQEYYPLTKAQVLAQWFTWMETEYAVTVPDGTTLLDTDTLPRIKDVTDEILKQAIICEVSKRPFRIIKSELEYYRKNDIDLPRRHPGQRHYDRMALRNPRKLFNRKCDKCWIEMKTTYSPERPEIVYCETCYNREIYG